MLIPIGVLWPAFLLLGRTTCSTLNASGCIGPITVASNCNFYDSKLSECNSFTGSQAASCYCPQSVLNAIAGCESELRVCAEGYEFDSNFTGTTGFYALWHSACDGVITYSPTTPVLTSLSLTFDPLNCLSAQSYCQNFGVLTDACSASITESSELHSCMCQSSVLALASRCYIDGSISCEFKTPTLTNLFSYQYCRGSATGGSPPVIVSSTRVTVTSQVPTAGPPPSPSLTASSSGPSATSPSSGTGCHGLKLRWSTAVACWVVVAGLIVLG